LLFKAIHYGPACRQAGIEWFSCILSVVFLLPVLLFYLFLPHFTLPGLLVPVGEHTLKTGPEFFYSRVFRVFFAKVTVIGNVPPVTFTGPFT
jgi:hypothetical protein